MIADYRDKHKGESMLVCGTGSSLLDVPRKPPIPSIGVNDCYNVIDEDGKETNCGVETDYLVILGDPDAHFTPERRKVINSSKPKATFMSKADLLVWERYWEFRYGELIELNGVAFTHDFPWGKPIKKGRIYSVPSTSPGTALGLALYMGATRIGVIGVDLKTHPNLAKHISVLNERFHMMNGVAAAYGARIFNLASEDKSDLTAFPHATYTDFLSCVSSAGPSSRCCHERL